MREMKTKQMEDEVVVLGQKMEGEITLVLDRQFDDLWIDVDDNHKIVIWDVTGLEWDNEAAINHFKILRRGKQIGGTWNVKEIKERW